MRYRRDGIVKGRNLDERRRCQAGFSSGIRDGDFNSTKRGVGYGRAVAEGYCPERSYEIGSSVAGSAGERHHIAGNASGYP